MALDDCKPIHCLSPKDVNRFWSKVEKGGDEQCWPWKEGVFPGGYGHFWTVQRELKAHRVAYFLSTGIDPGEKRVCHSCDNPRCCNYSHMFLGSYADNIRDRHRKGHTASGDKQGFRVHPELTPRGEQNGSSKLTAESVLEIRRLCQSGSLTYRAIGKLFGICGGHAKKIGNRELWRHVT